MADRLKRSGNPGSPPRADVARGGVVNPLLYLYGITEEPVSLPATLRGVDGTSLIETVECSGLTCWTSRVDVVEFGDKLQQNMENLEWLADASVRHQRVVGAIHEKETILPARFGIVFLSAESLGEDVAARKAALKAGFQRVTGADEWGIRVFALPRPAPAAGGARSGREYLEKKSAMLQTRPSRSLEPEIQEFSEAVSKLATTSAEGGKVGSGQPGLRWQTSILLPRTRRLKLEALLARFDRRFQNRFRVECTGPWPPYSFAGETARARPTASSEVTR